MDGKRVRTMEELKDSRLLFDKQPPAFGFFFLLLIFVSFLLLLAWSMKAPKVYTIQTQGVVTNEEANYVMCTYTGEIDRCFMEEGMLVEQGDLLLTIKSTDYDLQEKQLQENRESLELVIRQNQRLVNSIKDNVNYFEERLEEDSLYYHTYERYQAKVEQTKMDASMFQAYGYTKEQMEEELLKNQSKTEEVYYSAIQEAEAAMAQAKQQLDQIDSQLLAVQSGQEAYEIKATASGVLHMTEQYKPGMVLQSTTVLATITPQNSRQILEAYVTTADRARMKEGNEVQFVVDGLSQAVYGNLKGRVKRMDSDVTVKQTGEGEARVFRVWMEMDENYLVSRSGDKIDVVTGMTATARIHYDKVTYFQYVLEKLGFKAK